MKTSKYILCIVALFSVISLFFQSCRDDDEVPEAIPVSPSGLEVNDKSATAINLSWEDHSDNELGFKIERSIGTSNAFTEQGTVGPNVTTYTSDALTPNTQYTFRVKAYNTIGASGYSNTAVIVTDDIAPLSPTELVAETVSSSEIKLIWKDNSDNETGFKIERASGSSTTFTDLAVVDPNVIAYSNDSLAPGTQYAYRVKAYNNIGDSDYSNNISAVTSASLSASDLIVSLDENPNNGRILGTIATNITESLVFTMTSQTPEGAMGIDDRGAIYIVEASKFDFETNPILEAMISVTNSSETASAVVRVELNNVDDIASFLSESRADYEASENGRWVQVTENEYKTLANRLNEVTKSGTSDNQYESTSARVPLAANHTIANTNGHTMPDNSYVFAFKYYSLENQVLHSRVKLAYGSLALGLFDLGMLLPTHGRGNNYFVLKGNDLNHNDIGYLAFYSSTDSFIRSIPGTGCYYSFGNTNILNQGRSGTAIYQGLSTTQKQWD